MQFLAGMFETIHDGGGDDDCCSMLVVVEYGNVHAFAQAALDLETFRRLDVFEIDAAKGWFQRRHHIAEFVDAVLVHFDVKYINAGEFLEQDSLAFHDRFGGQWPDIAETENGRAVGNDCDQISACGVTGSQGWFCGNCQARCCNARRIGKRQVALVAQRLGCFDCQFAGARKLVIVQRTCFQLIGWLIGSACLRLVVLTGHGGFR